MCIIESILTKIYTIADAFLGERVLRETELNEVNKIDFYSKFGNHLKIVVTKKQYLLENKDKTLLRRGKKSFSVYEVQAEFSDELPVLLNNILTEKIVLPQLLNRFISEEKQINSVVNAFLDIKLKQFRKEIKKKAT